MTTVSKVKRGSKKMRPTAGERLCVGIDVHKGDYKVAVWSYLRESIVWEWVQPPKAGCLVEMLDPYKSGVEKVVYEAGPTGFGLARAVRRCGFAVDVVAPSLTPQTPGSVSKSDRLDARNLAQMGSAKKLGAVYVLSEEEESDRQVRRMRETMSRNVRKTKNRIKSFLLQHGLEEPAGLRTWTQGSIAALGAMDLDPGLRFSLDLFLDDLRHGQEQIGKADAALRGLSGLPRHRHALEMMRTVPGVGPVTATTVRLELPSPQRFNDKEEVAQITGLAPQVRSSGQTRKEGRVNKQGNPRLRTALIEAAWQWVFRDPGAARRFKRYFAKTASKKKAIVAMARRLGIILWRIQVTGEPYRGFESDGPNDPRPANKPKTKAKRTKTRKTAA